MSVLNSYSVLGEKTPLKVGGADIHVAEHFLNITSCPGMDFRKILNGGAGWQAPVSETLGVLTVTPVSPSVNSTVYAFQLQQDRPDLGVTVTALISYTAQAAGTTQTIVSNAFRAAIAANPNFRITLTGTTTLIMTAKTGFPAIRAVNLSSVSTNIGTAPFVTTPYVISKGTYADLLRAGVAAGDIAAGHTYYQIPFLFVSSDPKDFTTEDTVRQHTLYVYGSDANFAAFNTLMLSTLKAYKPATTVSDPKALEIVS